VGWRGLEGFIESGTTTSCFLEFSLFVIVFLFFIYCYHPPAFIFPLYIMCVNIRHQLIFHYFLLSKGLISVSFLPLVGTVWLGAEAPESFSSIQFFLFEFFFYIHMSYVFSGFD